MISLKKMSHLEAELTKRNIFYQYIYNIFFTRVLYHVRNATKIC